MKQIHKIIHGSCLYGCNTEMSDKDYLGIMIPSRSDILLGNIPRTYTEKSNIDKNKKNNNTDSDFQLTSLSKYLLDLCSGQTYALEILFAPEQFWVEQPHEVWFSVLKNKNKFISKNITSMIGYATAQARKYGQKSKRLEVFDYIVNHLKRFRQTPQSQVFRAFLDFDLMIEENPWMKDFVKIETMDSDISNSMRYLKVNNVAVPLTVSIEYALEVYSRHLNEYGKRAKQARDDKGLDLKAQYHAIRIIKQATELLQTGYITFPRPEKDLLLAIRQGKYSELELKDLTDNLFEECRQAEKISTLQEKPDLNWIKDLICDTHYDIVTGKI